MTDKQMRIRTAISAIVLALFFSTSHVSAEPQAKPELEGLIKALAQRHADVKVVAASFRQEKIFSFMTKPVVADGFMIYERTGGLRFELVRPFPSTVLNDGKTVRRYEKTADQWKAIEFGNNRNLKLVMEQIGLWMQGQFSTEDKVFKLSLSFDDPNSYAELNLTPRIRQMQAYIETIKISLSAPPELGVRSIIIYEPGGDYTRMTFVRELRNVPLPEGCFVRPEQSGACQKLFEAKTERESDGKSPEGQVGEDAKPEGS